MMTVQTLSRLSGVSVRALHHYDAIGLLPPTQVTAAGYRLYDGAAVQRLQLILLFRELRFPLREIGRILDSPNFDRERALQQQIRLLELQKTQLEDLISLAQSLQKLGVEHSMDFSAFDRSKQEAYAKEAKKNWGDTEAYREFCGKSAGRSRERDTALQHELMVLFQEFGAIRDQQPTSEAAQKLVSRLQSFISEHYYRCTPEILTSLGEMYAAGGDFTENIDRVGGAGTAAFAQAAIRQYCR